jgi:hypothetical protein
VGGVFTRLIKGMSVNQCFHQVMDVTTSNPKIRRCLEITWSGVVFGSRHLLRPDGDRQPSRRAILESHLCFLRRILGPITSRYRNDTANRLLRLRLSSKHQRPTGTCLEDVCKAILHAAIGYELSRTCLAIFSLYRSA